MRDVFLSVEFWFRKRRLAEFGRRTDRMLRTLEVRRRGRRHLARFDAINVDIACAQVDSLEHRHRLREGRDHLTRRFSDGHSAVAAHRTAIDQATAELAALIDDRMALLRAGSEYDIPALSRDPGRPAACRTRGRPVATPTGRVPSGRAQAKGLPPY